VTSRLFRAGRNAVQVQRQLGHHKPSFTINVYTHLLDDALAEPVAVPVGNESSEGSRDAPAPAMAEMAI
jgi:integrase